MNLFAVNAAEVNGSIEVWSWYGDASVAVDATGEILVGLTMQGDAQVITAGELLPSVRMIPGLTPSAVNVSSAGELIFGRPVEGSASVVVSATGRVTRVTFGEGAANVVFELDGDASVVQPAAGSFTISVESWMDGAVSTVAQGEGPANIVVQSSLTPHYARPGYIVSDTAIVLASIAVPYLVIDGPPASASALVAADGEARLGDKLYLEGDAGFDIFARGELGSLHYVRLEGGATIALEAMMAQAGIPQTPTDYVPAPVARTIIVSREARSMTVAREDRRV